MRQTRSTGWSHGPPGTPWGASPHGGWTETAAKAAFLVLIAALLFGKARAYQTAHPPPPPLPEAEETALVSQARSVADAFAAKGDAWTPDDIVAVRNGLVEIRERLAWNPTGHTSVDDLLRAHVSGALDRAESASALAGDVKTRQVQWDRARVARQALMATPPRTFAPISDTSFARGLWWLFLKALQAYALFMPFVFLALCARIVRYRLSFADEVAFGWRNLALSTLAWPLGLAEYPRSSARELRRRRVEMEYLARVGKDWRTMTAGDEAAIARLVDAPREELRAALDAIKVMPWHALMRARVGLAATFLVGLLSTAARAQAAAPAPEPDKVAVTADGVAQVRTGTGKDASLGIERVMVEGRVTRGPYEGKLRLILTGKGLVLVKEAFADVPLAARLRLHAGVITLRPAFLAPAPWGERLLDGPRAEDLMSFTGIGAQVVYARDKSEAAFGVFADDPSARYPRSTFLYGATPLGPFALQAAFEAGMPHDNVRLRGGLDVTADVGPMTFDALCTAQRLGTDNALVCSGMAAWRAESRLDLAAGYDRTWPSQGPPDNVVRAQATALGWNGKLQLGLLGRWSRLLGFGAEARLQAAF